VEAAGYGNLAGTEVEILAKAERWQFTAEYKLTILGEANHCSQPGEIGAVIRREGLYWRNLSNWRKSRERSRLVVVGEKTRGP
jgi:transposase